MDERASHVGAAFEVFPQKKRARITRAQLRSNDSKGFGPKVSQQFQAGTVIKKPGHDSTNLTRSAEMTKPTRRRSGIMRLWLSHVNDCRRSFSFLTSVAFSEIPLSHILVRGAGQ